MADAVSTQTLMDNVKNVVMKFTNTSDGTGESAVVKVDVSALNGAPTEVKINKIHYDVAGMVVRLLWDADADVTCVDLQGDGCFDATGYGGLINNGGTGVTGDIRFTTIGHTSGDSYSIILEMSKK
jgi:hypothetical protein